MDYQMKKYKEEVKQRWGNTKAYKQSEQRTKNWIKEDYRKIEGEEKLLTLELANLMKKGIENSEVQSLIEKHYEGIQRFYDCSYEMYLNLGKMYIEDYRFAAYYDKVKLGLAQFVCNAIIYYVKIHNKK